MVSTMSMLGITRNGHKQPLHDFLNTLVEVSLYAHLTDEEATRSEGWIMLNVSELVSQDVAPDVLLRTT